MAEQSLTILKKRMGRPCANAGLPGGHNRPHSIHGSPSELSIAGGSGGLIPAATSSNRSTNGDMLALIEHIHVLTGGMKTALEKQERTSPYKASASSTMVMLEIKRHASRALTLDDQWMHSLSR